jgi:hypothetical protein
MQKLISKGKSPDAIPGGAERLSLEAKVALAELDMAMGKPGAMTQYQSATKERDIFVAKTEAAKTIDNLSRELRLDELKVQQVRIAEELQKLNEKIGTAEPTFEQARLKESLEIAQKANELETLRVKAELSGTKEAWAQYEQANRRAGVELAELEIKDLTETRKAVIQKIDQLRNELKTGRNAEGEAIDTKAHENQIKALEERVKVLDEGLKLGGKEKRNIQDGKVSHDFVKDMDAYRATLEPLSQTAKWDLDSAKGKLQNLIDFERERLNSESLDPTMKELTEKRIQLFEKELELLGTRETLYEASERLQRSKTPEEAQGIRVEIEGIRAEAQKIRQEAYQLYEKDLKAEFGVQDAKGKSLIHRLMDTPMDRAEYAELAKARDQVVQKVFGKPFGELSETEGKVLAEFVTREAYLREFKTFDEGRWAFQQEMIEENLAGRIVALGMGGGKTAGYTDVFGVRSAGGALRGEIIVSSSGEMAQYLKSDGIYQQIARALGYEYKNGSRYYDSRQAGGLGELVKEIESGRNHVMVYDSDTRGHLQRETYFNHDLKRALKSVTDRAIDEADVMALAQKAFIEGKQIYAEGKLVDRGGLFLDLMENIDGRGTKVERVKMAELDDTKFQFAQDPRTGEYKVSRSLGMLLEKEGFSTGQIQDMIRGFAAREGVEYGMVDGKMNTASWEGSVEIGTKDNSAAYITILTLRENMRLAQIYTDKTMKEGKTKAEARAEWERMSVEEQNAWLRDNGIAGTVTARNKIEVSSSGKEATLSEIFGSGRNFGGSGTMEVAKQIAEAIYGSSVIDIGEASFQKFPAAVRFIDQLKGKDRQAISQVEYAAQTALYDYKGEYVYEKGKGKEDSARYLRSELSIDRQREVITIDDAKAKELYVREGGSSSKWDKMTMEEKQLYYEKAVQQLPEGTLYTDKRSTLIRVSGPEQMRDVIVDILRKANSADTTKLEILDNIIRETANDKRLYYGDGENFGLLDLARKAGLEMADKINIADPFTEPMNPGRIYEMAIRAGKGSITIVSDVAMRAFDFGKEGGNAKDGFISGGVDLIMLDGHNMISGNMLQGLGRTGRSDRVTFREVLLDRNAVKENLEFAEQVKNFLVDRGSKQAGEFSRLLEIAQWDKMKAGSTELDGLTVLEGNSTVMALIRKSNSVSFKLGTEPEGILLKRPLAEMLGSASEGSKSFEILNKAYQKVLSRERAEADIYREDGLKTPEEIAKSRFERTANHAKEIWLELAKNKELSAEFRREAYKRALDIMSVDWNTVKADKSRSFTDAPTDRPAEYVASIVKSLAEYILPSESSTSSAPKLVSIKNVEAAMDALRSYTTDIMHMPTREETRIALSIGSIRGPTGKGIAVLPAWTNIVFNATQDNPLYSTVVAQVQSAIKDPKSLLNSTTATAAEKVAFLQRIAYQAATASGVNVNIVMPKLQELVFLAVNPTLLREAPRLEAGMDLDIGSTLKSLGVVSKVIPSIEEEATKRFSQSQVWVVQVPPALTNDGKVQDAFIATAYAGIGANQGRIILTDSQGKHFNIAASQADALKFLDQVSVNRFTPTSDTRLGNMPQSQQTQFFGLQTLLGDMGLDVFLTPTVSSTMKALGALYAAPQEAMLHSYISKAVTQIKDLNLIHTILMGLTPSNESIANLGLCKEAATQLVAFRDKLLTNLIMRGDVDKLMPMLVSLIQTIGVKPAAEVKTPVEEGKSAEESGAKTEAMLAGIVVKADGFDRNIAAMIIQFANLDVPEGAKPTYLNGRMTQLEMKDNEETVTTYHYTQEGKVASILRTLKNGTILEYAANSQLERIVTPDKQVLTDLQFDQEGKLTGYTATLPNGDRQLFKDGKIVEAIVGDMRLVYDAQGQVISKELVKPKAAQLALPTIIVNDKEMVQVTVPDIGVVLVSAQDWQLNPDLALKVAIEKAQAERGRKEVLPQGLSQPTKVIKDIRPSIEKTQQPLLVLPEWPNRKPSNQNEQTDAAMNVSIQNLRSAIAELTQGRSELFVVALRQLADLAGVPEWVDEYLNDYEQAHGLRANWTFDDWRVVGRQVLCGLNVEVFLDAGWVLDLDAQGEVKSARVQSFSTVPYGDNTVIMVAIDDRDNCFISAKSQAATTLPYIVFKASQFVAEQRENYRFLMSSEAEQLNWGPLLGRMRTIEENGYVEMGLQLAAREEWVHMMDYDRVIRAQANTPTHTLPPDELISNIFASEQQASILSRAVSSELMAQFKQALFQGLVKQDDLLESALEAHADIEHLLLASSKEHQQYALARLLTLNSEAGSESLAHQLAARAVLIAVASVISGKPERELISQETVTLTLVKLEPQQLFEQLKELATAQAQPGASPVAKVRQDSETMAEGINLVRDTFDKLIKLSEVEPAESIEILKPWLNELNIAGLSLEEVIKGVGGISALSELAREKTILNVSECGVAALMYLLETLGKEVSKEKIAQQVIFAMVAALANGEIPQEAMDHTETLGLPVTFKVLHQVALLYGEKLTGYQVDGLSGIASVIAKTPGILHAKSQAGDHLLTALYGIPSTAVLAKETNGYETIINAATTEGIVTGAVLIPVGMVKEPLDGLTPIVDLTQHYGRSPPIFEPATPSQLAAFYAKYYRATGLAEQLKIIHPNVSLPKKVLVALRPKNIPNTLKTYQRGIGIFTSLLSLAFMLLIPASAPLFLKTLLMGLPSLLTLPAMLPTMLASIAAAKGGKPAAQAKQTPQTGNKYESILSLGIGAALALAGPHLPFIASLGLSGMVLFNIGSTGVRSFVYLAEKLSGIISKAGTLKKSVGSLFSTITDRARNMVKKPVTTPVPAESPAQVQPAAVVQHPAAQVAKLAPAPQPTQTSQPAAENALQKLINNAPKARDLVSLRKKRSRWHAVKGKVRYGSGKTSVTLNPDAPVFFNGPTLVGWIQGQVLYLHNNPVNVQLHLNGDAQVIDVTIPQKYSVEDLDRFIQELKEARDEQDQSLPSVVLEPVEKAVKAQLSQMQTAQESAQPGVAVQPAAKPVQPAEVANAPQQAVPVSQPAAEVVEAAAGHVAEVAPAPQPAPAKIDRNDLLGMMFGALSLGLGSSFIMWVAAPLVAVPVLTSIAMAGFGFTGLYTLTTVAKYLKLVYEGVPSIKPEQEIDSLNPFVRAHGLLHQFLDGIPVLRLLGTHESFVHIFDIIFIVIPIAPLFIGIELAQKAIAKLKHPAASMSTVSPQVGVTATREWKKFRGILEEAFDRQQRLPRVTFDNNGYGTPAAQLKVTVDKNGNITSKQEEINGPLFNSLLSHKDDQEYGKDFKHVAIGIFSQDLVHFNNIDDYDTRLLANLKMKYEAAEKANPTSDETKAWAKALASAQLYYEAKGYAQLYDYLRDNQVTVDRIREMAIKALSPAEDLLKDTLMQLAEFMENYDKYGVAYASAMDLTTGESYIAKSIRTALEDATFNANLKEYKTVANIEAVEITIFIEGALGRPLDIIGVKSTAPTEGIQLTFGGSLSLDVMLFNGEKVHSDIEGFMITFDKIKEKKPNTIVIIIAESQEQVDLLRPKLPADEERLKIEVLRGHAWTQYNQQYQLALKTNEIFEGFVVVSGSKIPEDNSALKEALTGV